MAIRVTQNVTEAVILPDTPNLRVTQIVAEVVILASNLARAFGYIIA